ncbi:MAG: ABATE domain-containing protein [Nitrospira sp. BO4]|jgi:predicted RNA-binding Zn ribbon-like protein|nr:ABATE domain-containing protein [Nitrospira sp. BO4]
MKNRSQRFLFVGNHPCLDLINTQLVVKGEPRELLETFDDLFGWLIRARLLPVSQAKAAKSHLNNEEAASLLERAKTLRATLRTIAEQVAVGGAVPGSAINTMNQFLAQRPGYPELLRTKEGITQRFHSLATQQVELLAPFLEAACDLLSSDRLCLIKKCANAACVLYFLDTTKNHTRNWCSMQMCGNRMKVAAHYRRSRTKAGL